VHARTLAACFDHFPLKFIHNALVLSIEQNIIRRGVALKVSTEISSATDKAAKQQS